MTSCGFTVFDIELVRGEMMRDKLKRVRICRGTAQGCSAFMSMQCNYCYVIERDDARSSAEILQAIERGHA